MKKTLSFVLLVLVFLSTGITAAKVPDLQGNWTGSWSGYEDGKGYPNLSENGSILYNIDDQKDRLFAGNLTIMLKNETVKASGGFAGAIGLDNKTLFVTRFEKGYSLGTIISNDEIELVYLSDGKGGWVAIDKLYRIKV
jgi:hypothetical protein